MEILIATQNTVHFNLELAIQVALLHDTLEDTQTTIEELINHFGMKVAEGVLALTKDSDLAKDRQMEDCLSRIKHQPMEVWSVKLADRITNLQPPPAVWDDQKRIRYQEESRHILIELSVGNKYLAERLSEKIEEYGKFIGGKNDDEKSMSDKT
jgi:guanosine-3',5'-bis(diphosphate) 3'-pyrophosphohydrolase